MIFWSYRPPLQEVFSVGYSLSVCYTLSLWELILAVANHPDELCINTHLYMALPLTNVFTLKWWILLHEQCCYFQHDSHVWYVTWASHWVRINHMLEKLLHVEFFSFLFFCKKIPVPSCSMMFLLKMMCIWRWLTGILCSPQLFGSMRACRESVRVQQWRSVFPFSS